MTLNISLSSLSLSSPIPSSIPPYSPSPYSTMPPPLCRRRHDYPLAAVAAGFVSMFLIFYRKISRKRTVPADLKPLPLPPPQRFSYSFLRRATDSFSDANRLGQGGFGSVYRGVLPSGKEIAVKLMSEASIQGEREFYNEITVASSLDTVSCPHVFCVIGFSTSAARGGNGYGLRLCGPRESAGRERRLLLVYEHMKNGSLQDALLDRKCGELMDWRKRFSIVISIAKGIDYLHNHCTPPIVHGDIKPSNVLLDSNFDAKIADFGLAHFLIDGEEIEKKRAAAANVDRSPARIPGEGEALGFVYPSPPLETLEKQGSASERKLSRISLDSLIAQQERPKMDLISRNSNSNSNSIQGEGKKLERWASLDSNATAKEKGIIRQPREWWKEEFCDELAKKTKKIDPNDREETIKKRSRRRSASSFECLSGEFRIVGRRSIQDREISKTRGGITSTPSMRGNVCYAAPENGGASAQVSAKCDVYSFGVLLLVMVSGRRPLQVMASRMSERANLIAWARQLAMNGKLLELVDPNVQCLDKQQAVVCITVALLCLQRLPDKRPAMSDILRMLTGESDPPHLPREFSQSPPCNFPFRLRRRKTRC